MLCYNQLHDRLCYFDHFVELDINMTMTGSVGDLYLIIKHASLYENLHFISSTITQLAQKKIIVALNKSGSHSANPKHHFLFC